MFATIATPVEDKIIYFDDKINIELGGETYGVNLILASTTRPGAKIAYSYGEGKWALQLKPGLFDPKNNHVMISFGFECPELGLCDRTETRHLIYITDPITSHEMFGQNFVLQDGTTLYKCDDLVITQEESLSGFYYNSNNSSIPVDITF